MAVTKKYVLALDQGTSSSKAFLFNRQGKIVSSASIDFRQIYPKPGWVEHDPDEIWESQIVAALKAVTQARIDPAEIAALGITNQRETTILWDRSSGKPIANAIVWQCRRTAERCDQLKREGRSGLEEDGQFHPARRGVSL